MHTLIWHGRKTDSPGIEAQLNESGALGISVSEDGGVTFVQAWFDNQISIDLAGDYRWEAVDPKQWNQVSTVSVGGVEIDCSAIVFGDGRHATTMMCLELLETVVAQASDPSALSCLDVGTGSGILAIAAWQLGIREVQGFDYDELAVTQAQENAIKIGMPPDRFILGDAHTYTGLKKSLVLANILTQILEESLPNILSNLEPKGYLIVSGVGVQWQQVIEKRFRSLDLVILECRSLDGWLAYLREAP